MANVTERTAALACVLVIALVGTGCGTRTAANGHSVHARATTMTVDLGKKAKFTPAPAGANPKLTQQQAWARYIKSTRSDTSHRSLTIPRNVSARLGVLTVPIGPVGRHGAIAYLAHKKLVYGYSWHSCPQSQAPGGTLPPNPCIEWNFLNANTGAQIVETWQVFH